MPHKEKMAAEEKIRIVEGYLSGKIGYWEAIRLAGAHKKTVAGWISRYKTEGPAGFLPQAGNRSYSKEQNWRQYWITLQGKAAYRQYASSIKFVPTGNFGIGSRCIIVMRTSKSRVEAAA